jgi:hypothetical protein
MREDQLPMLVKFDKDPAEDLAHALTVEEVTVPTDVLVDGYFSTLMATYIMPHVTHAQDGVEMNLSNLCPIPLAWAPYFYGFQGTIQGPWNSQSIGNIIGNATHWTLAAPLLHARLGANAADQTQSLLNQGFEPATPDARVIRWMKTRLAPYQKGGPTPAAAPPMGMTGGPVLPGNLAATVSREKESTTLETSKI